MKTTTTLAVMALLLGGLTACGGNSPNAAQSAAKVSAAAKASAVAQASVSLATACKDLQNFNSGDTAAAKTISMRLAGTKTGTDFSRMMRDINNGDTEYAFTAGLALAADCLAKTGITVHMIMTGTDINGNKTCQPLDLNSACPSDNPAPTSTMTRQTDTIVFSVMGSGYPSIQYGTDSNNNDVPGGYGPLGDGVALPWSASMPYTPNALYYAVTAQLEGYGSISDSVTEAVTTYCSNGHHKTERFPLASGHASGGYAIAQAQYNALGAGTGNTQQAESDAGC